MHLYFARSRQSKTSKREKKTGKNKYIVKVTYKYTVSTYRVTWMSYNNGLFLKVCSFKWGDI